MEINGIGSGYIYGALPPSVREAIQNAAGRVYHEAVDTAKETAHVLTHPDEWGSRLKQAAAPIIKLVEEDPGSLLM